MTRSAALLIGEITHARKEWADLASRVTLKEYPSGSREDFIEKCQDGSFDDVFVIYRSNESTSVTGPFNAELVSKLPKSLKYICHNGAGYDNIEVSACTERGISISSTPVAVNDATADIAIFLMIGALRKIHIPLTAVRQGAWRGKAFGLGHDPEKKTLGIIGMGGIGTEVAKRARAFGMRIIYRNLTQLSPEKEAEYGVKFVSFDELLSQSDVISLNLSLNRSTRHIISTPEFEKMKDGVVIINTARGALIDEKALVKALESGKVSSVGLDVYESEPQIEPGLLNNENVVLLPHIGTATFETQRDMELLVLENLKSALSSGTLITQVPEQKKIKV
ncbi:MAG: hypothetical protein M1834_007510 [Cirrosporium novae-zelandiae]|nr:MAG: hypothetical protein M1834_007510 [Cirrosporium novae-zelandiae]